MKMNLSVDIPLKFVESRELCKDLVVKLSKGKRLLVCVDDMELFSYKEKSDTGTVFCIRVAEERKVDVQ